MTDTERERAAFRAWANSKDAPTRADYGLGYWGMDMAFRAWLAAKAHVREAVAAWMHERAYATGHGDTIEGLLGELEWQAKERGQAHARGEARMREYWDGSCLNPEGCNTPGPCVVVHGVCRLALTERPGHE